MRRFQIAIPYTGLKHPLAAPVRTGLDVLVRLNLKAESSMTDDIDDLEDYAGVLTSAHAPASNGGMRLNVAATDAEYRRMSIDRILAFVDTARRYPNVRQVNIHFAPKRWVDDAQTAGQEGDYDLLIDAAREIAEFSTKYGIEIVMENNNAYWSGIADDVPAGDVDWTDRNRSFGMVPEEWCQVCLDVDRPNLGLCLDSSHTCTYASTFPEEQREERVLAFLARPELIRHVHWNDNYLYDTRGRTDSHALIGKGSLPIEMHRQIKHLDATLLLEHFYSTEELEEELEFINSL